MFSISFTKVKKQNFVWVYILMVIKAARVNHVSPMSHFYTPWKCQKTYGFLMFSGVIKM